MGEGARIDDDETGAIASGCVNALDQDMLGVALQGRQAVPAPPRRLGQAALDVLQRVLAVHGWFPGPQQIQVRTI